MNRFGNRNFMQPMGRLNMRSKCLDFFSFKFWVGVGEGFFHFSFVPNMFPSSSQWVLIRFSICSLGSQCVPQGCSQYHLIYCQMFCPKSSPSHLYRWAKGGGTPSFHRIFYFGGASIVSTLFLGWANQIGSLKKKKVGLVRYLQLIITNPNKYHQFR